MLGNPCSTGRPSPTGILHLLMSPLALAVLFLPVGTSSLIKLLVLSCTWLSFLHPLLQFSWALFTGYAGTSLSRGVPLRRCRHYVPCTHTHCCIVSLGRDLANGDVLVALMVPGSDDPEFSTYHCRLSNCSRPLTLRGALLRIPKRIKALHVLIIATSTLSALSFYPLDSWNSLRKKLVQQLNNREWESRQVRDSSVPESYPLQSSVASLATDWWMEPWPPAMIEICTNEPMA